MSPTGTAARYLDGVSARPQTVEVAVSPAGLVFTTDDGRTRLWKAAEMRRIPGERGDRDLLVTTTSTDAMLVFPDDSLLPLLRRSSPELEARSRLTPRLRRGLALWLTATVAMVVAGYFLIPPAAGALASLIPQAWEDRLGDRLRPVIMEALTQTGDTARTCDDPASQRALDGLATRLAAAGGLTRLPKVELVDLRLTNAFALPGDRVVITRGVISFMQGPDELAAVLAHELGHLKHKDPIAGFIGYLGWDALSSVVLGTGITASVGRSLIVLANSRSVEARADGFAMETLRAAGLDGHGASRFMQRMAETGGADLGYLSSHPPSAARAAAMAAGAVAGRPGLGASEWAALSRACD